MTTKKRSPELQAMIDIVKANTLIQPMTEEEIEKYAKRDPNGFAAAVAASKILNSAK